MNTKDTATFDDVRRARHLLQLDLSSQHRAEDVRVSVAELRGLQSLDRAKSATIEELQRVVAGRSVTREPLDLDRLGNSRFEVCPHCHGTGQEPGVPAPHMCARCPGSGRIYVPGGRW